MITSTLLYMCMRMRVAKSTLTGGGRAREPRSCRGSGPDVPSRVLSLGVRVEHTPKSTAIKDQIEPCGRHICVCVCQV
jgi:hypothetical protein